jgi:hypothetical protein
MMHSHKLLILYKSVYEVICVLPNRLYSQTVCFFNRQLILCSSSSFSDTATNFQGHQVFHFDLQTLAWYMCRNIYNLPLYSYSRLQSPLWFLQQLLSKWWSCLGFSHHVVIVHSNISQHIPLKHQNRPLLYDIKPTPH